MVKMVKFMLCVFIAIKKIGHLSVYSERLISDSRYMIQKIFIHETCRSHFFAHLSQLTIGNNVRERS